MMKKPYPELFRVEDENKRSSVPLQNTNNLNTIAPYVIAYSRMCTRLQIRENKQNSTTPGTGMALPEPITMPYLSYSDF